MPAPPLPAILAAFADQVGDHATENRGWSLDYTYATRELVIIANDSGLEFRAVMPPGTSKDDVLGWQEELIQRAQGRRRGR